MKVSWSPVSAALDIRCDLEKKTHEFVYCLARSLVPTTFITLRSVQISRKEDFRESVKNIFLEMWEGIGRILCH